MPTIPTQSLSPGQYITVDVLDYNPDGTTIDSTEALSFSSSAPSVAVPTIDPANNRRVKISALAAGPAEINIWAPGVPTEGILKVPVEVVAPANLSRIELAPSGIQGPFLS